MNILFVTSCFDTKMDPVSNIIERLIPFFQEQGCCVDIACFKTTPNEPSEKEIDAVRLYKCFSSEYCHRTQIKNPFALADKIIQKVLKKTGMAFLNSTSSSDMAAMLQRLYCQTDYDAIIPVCGRYEIYDAVRKSKPTAPVYLYQCDPLATNKTFRANTLRRREKYEKQMFSACKAVFTTPIIYQTARIDYPSVKFIPLEFPNIRPEPMGYTVSQPDTALFGGLFYPVIREPHYTLELFGLLQKEGITLNIAGGGMADAVNHYCETYKNIKLLGSLNMEDFRRQMELATVLVNIGNTSDQVPSKIFDYMSVGKPILNICQRRDCSTLPYLSKYPLCLSVFTDEPPQMQVERVAEFIRSCNGKYVPYEEVEKLFPKCTVGYVAERIIEELPKPGRA